MTARQHLIVALDLPDHEQLLTLAAKLRDEVAMVKIGLEAFVAHGPDLVHRLVDQGLEVFLDLKLHDIPRTAAAAARMASRMGVGLLTVHAGGGAAMVAAVREATSPRTRVIAVTVLTSLDDPALQSLGYRCGVTETATTLGGLALAAGADGLVCSAHELATLAPLPGLRVVPGVRPVGSDAGDQVRVATPREAVDAGADYIVVGRPILLAPDPIAAVRGIDATLIP